MENVSIIKLSDKYSKLCFFLFHLYLFHFRSQSRREYNGTKRTKTTLAARSKSPSFFPPFFLSLRFFSIQFPWLSIKTNSAKKMEERDSEKQFQIRALTGESVTVSISTNKTIADLKLLLTQIFPLATKYSNFNLFHKVRLPSLSFNFEY